MKNLSLKTRIAIFVTVVFFACVPIVAHLTFAVFKEQFKATIKTQQTTLVSRIADELDYKIQATHGALIKAAESASPTVVTSPGRASGFLGGLPALRAIFDNGVILFDRSGRILAETAVKPGRIGMDFSDREYVIATLKSGRPYVSSPFISRQSHRHPVIMFTAPIRDAGGRLAGIMAGSIDLLKENFLGSLAAAKIGKSGYFYLFTSDRGMIMHPDRERIMKSGAPAGVNRWLELASPGDDISAETVGSRGLPSISTFSRLRAVRWVLAADYPTAEAYGPLNEFERSARWGIASGWLFIVAVMWLFMHRLTRPMLSLAQQIRQNEEDGSYRNFVVESGGEIGEVADALNSLMDRLKEKEERLYYLTVHDGMTGLYNRLFFEGEMERLGQGRHFPVSLIMADIDNLKWVNDNLGHADGDRLILMAAKTLRMALRAEDVVSRMGGDEFAVILEGANAAAAEEALRRVRDAMAALNDADGEPYLSLSLGAATAESGGRLYDALKLADQRMFEDKAAHKAAQSAAG